MNLLMKWRYEPDSFPQKREIEIGHLRLFTRKLSDKCFDLAGLLACLVAEPSRFVNAKQWHTQQK